MVLHTKKMMRVLRNPKTRFLQMFIALPTVSKRYDATTQPKKLTKSSASSTLICTCEVTIISIIVNLTLIRQKNRPKRKKRETMANENDSHSHLNTNIYFLLSYWLILLFYYYSILYSCLRCCIYDDMSILKELKCRWSDISMGIPSAEIGLVIIICCSCLLYSFMIIILYTCINSLILYWDRITIKNLAIIVKIIRGCSGMIILYIKEKLGYFYTSLEG